MFSPLPLTRHAAADRTNCPAGGSTLRTLGLRGAARQPAADTRGITMSLWSHLPLIVAAVALFAACVQPERSRAHAAATANVSTSAAGDFSVYDLGSTWRDQRGAVRTLASLRGTPRAVALVYTHCTNSCPLIVGELRRLAAASRAGIVLVSLDPARDTPGRLAEYAAEHGLDAARWTLLSGSDDDVRDLAAALGVRYRRTSPAELAHANAITLLDASGAVAHQQLTLAGTPETIAVARQLTR